MLDLGPVQKIQQTTILKNFEKVIERGERFKKYNKLQSLRTQCSCEKDDIGSKNTTNYNP